MDRPIPGFPRITTNPRKLGGKPCVRGLRLGVRDVLRAMAAWPDRARVLAEYPDLEPEDLVAVLEFAAAMSDWDALDSRLAGA